MQNLIKFAGVFTIAISTFSFERAFMASRFGQKVVEFKKSPSKKQLLVEKDSFLIEFQQVLSEFSNCRTRKKNPGREFTKKKNPGREFTKKKSRSRIHKKKIPVENSQKK